jgi:hypothetical protein
VRRALVLYSPSIVLFAWALVWAAGARSGGVVIVALLVEAGAVWLHVQEQLHRFRDGPEPAASFGLPRREADRRRTYRDFWLVAISLVLLWSAIQGQQTANDANRATRQNHVAILQGCALTKARLQDNVTRLEQTVDYLKDPRNVRENPGLVRTVREVSIPFNVRQIRVDRKNFPSSCGPPPALPRDLVRLVDR